MKLQMKTAKERKRKEPFNKHKAKNTKTNSLQTKSSREQFHLIGCAAALAYKVTQSDRTAAVGVSLIKQLFSFPEKLQSSELVLHLKAWTKPGQNKGRASAQTSLRRWSEGWKEFQTESKPKAPCWLLQQKERNSPQKLKIFNLFYHFMATVNITEAPALQSDRKLQSPYSPALNLYLNPPLSNYFTDRNSSQTGQGCPAERESFPFLHASPQKHKALTEDLLACRKEPPGRISSVKSPWLLVHSSNQHQTTCLATPQKHPKQGTHNTPTVNWKLCMNCQILSWFHVCPR